MDLFVDGTLCLLLLLDSQQVHQGPNGHALGNGEGGLDLSPRHTGGNGMGSAQLCAAGVTRQASRACGEGERRQGQEAGDVLLVLHTHKHLPLNRTVTAYVPPTCTKTVKKMTVMMAVRNMSLMPKCL